jgi:ATP-dependent Clp protease adaptor protein ClpS
MSPTSKETVHSRSGRWSCRLGQASASVRTSPIPSGVSATTPVLTPAEKRIESEQHSPLYHVVLLDDDEHTYDYVVEMLQKLFLMPTDVAFQHAVEVDTTGRTIVITCELPQAEFARDQVHAYGADPRMPKSKGSMSAVLVPASNTKTA